MQKISYQTIRQNKDHIARIAERYGFNGVFLSKIVFLSKTDEKRNTPKNLYIFILDDTAASNTASADNFKKDILKELKIESPITVYNGENVALADNMTIIHKKSDIFELINTSTKEKKELFENIIFQATLIEKLPEKKFYDQRKDEFNEIKEILGQAEIYKINRKNECVIRLNNKNIFNNKSFKKIFGPKENYIRIGNFLHFKKFPDNLNTLFANNYLFFNNANKGLTIKKNIKIFPAMDKITEEQIREQIIKENKDPKEMQEELNVLELIEKENMSSSIAQIMSALSPPQPQQFRNVNESSMEPINLSETSQYTSMSNSQPTVFNFREFSNKTQEQFDNSGKSERDEDETEPTHLPMSLENSQTQSDSNLGKRNYDEFSSESKRLDKEDLELLGLLEADPALFPADDEINLSNLEPESKMQKKS